MLMQFCLETSGHREGDRYPVAPSYGYSAGKQDRNPEFPSPSDESDNLHLRCPWTVSRAQLLTTSSALLLWLLFSGFPCGFPFKSPAGFAFPLPDWLTLTSAFCVGYQIGGDSVEIFFNNLLPVLMLCSLKIYPALWFFDLTDFFLHKVLNRIGVLNECVLRHPDFSIKTESFKLIFHQAMRQ
jgi:hypothetical protein